ncbi:hypothetical protein BJ508DRAFT_181822 [Ascobolus immersus RN42]|uniref:Uncharacterized protein n=1 Tax=Ascobolus immersus RN42 TaxID=1160509 RepID=A0A3N4HS62_ASCIM|nr:hypothetical protein BJ508DRAFT_181822 [Ascobolus immersus RN42]
MSELDSREKQAEKSTCSTKSVRWDYDMHERGHETTYEGQKRFNNRLSGRVPWPCQCHFTDTFTSALRSTVSWLRAAPHYRRAEEIIFYYGYQPLEIRSNPLPRSLRLLVEQYMLFFMNTFLPFAVGLKSPGFHETDNKYLMSLGECYMRVIYALGFSSYFERRQMAGLLRTNQLLLIELILKASMDLVKAWMILAASAGPATRIWEAVGCLKRVEAEIYRLYQTLISFFLSARFRSERLELLLVRYLSEPNDLNMEVIKGLDTAEEYFQRYNTGEEERPRIRPPTPDLD